MSNPYIQHKPRVRHSDVTKALERLNIARGYKYPDVGYVYYADIKGMTAQYRPSCWQIINANGGLRTAYDLQGSTIRKTLANIESHISALKADRSALQTDVTAG